MLCLGRQRELARLGDAAGRGRSLVVAGPPGIGKSTLLAAARDELGPRARLGVCLERLADRPYLPLLHAAGEVATPADDAAAARMVLRALGDDGVLLLDDLHWADPATVRVTLYLVGRRPVLAAVRAGAPGADALRRQLVEAGAGELALDGLDEEALLRVAASRRPDLGDGERRRLVRAAAGVPLHLLASLEDEDAEPRARLRARVRRLGPDAHRALALLALAGRPLPPGVAGDAVDRLLADGLAERVGGAVRPAHDLIGRAAVELLPEAERRALHAELAEGAPDDGDAAVHWQEAGEPERAVATALAAADAAGGVLERARLLAVAATNATGPQARCLRLRACRALAEAGDAVAAAGLLAGRGGRRRGRGAGGARADAGGRGVGRRRPRRDARRLRRRASRTSTGASPAIELELLLLRAQIPIWAWDVEAATVWTGRAQRPQRTARRAPRPRAHDARAGRLHPPRPRPASSSPAEARDIALAEGDAATAAEWPSFASRGAGRLRAGRRRAAARPRGHRSRGGAARPAPRRRRLRRAAHRPARAAAGRAQRRPRARGPARAAAGRTAARAGRGRARARPGGARPHGPGAPGARRRAPADAARRRGVAPGPRRDALRGGAPARRGRARGRARRRTRRSARSCGSSARGRRSTTASTIPELFASLGPPPYRRAADGATAAMRLLATRGPCPPVVVAFGAAATAAARSSAFEGLRCAWAAGEVARRGAEDERARALLERAEDEADRLGFEPLLARVRASLRRLGLRRHETRDAVRGLPGGSARCWSASRRACGRRRSRRAWASGRPPSSRSSVGPPASSARAPACRRRPSRSRRSVRWRRRRPRRACASSIPGPLGTLPARARPPACGRLRRARDIDEAVLAVARGSDLVVAVEPGALRDAALDALGRVAVVETDGEALLGPGAELEPEERQMLELLGSGLTISDAAEALHISRRTATGCWPGRARRSARVRPRRPCGCSPTRRRRPTARGTTARAARAGSRRPGSPSGRAP